jgi:hypothetical protein
VDSDELLASGARRRCSRSGCGENRGEIVLDIQAVRSGECGDVNAEDPAKLADGAIEYPARVVVAMCAELDDALIVGFDSREALATRGAHGPLVPGRGFGVEKHWLHDDLASRDLVYCGLLPIYRFPWLTWNLNLRSFLRLAHFKDDFATAPRTNSKAS